MGKGTQDENAMNVKGRSPMQPFTTTRNDESSTDQPTRSGVCSHRPHLACNDAAYGSPLSMMGCSSMLHSFK